MKTFSGTVQEGSKRAALLGYPTINIPLLDGSVSGVFVARVRAREQEYLAAAFADPARAILEAHLLDMAADMYGEEAEIELLEKLRETEAFESDTALKEMIARDVEQVRAYFKKAGV